MVVVLRAGGALVNAVSRPQSPKLGAVDRQLADEAAEHGIVGIVAGVHAEHGRCVSGDLIPVLVQLAGVGIEEHESGLIPLIGGHGFEIGDEESRDPVLAEYVEAPAEDEGRAPGRVESVEE
jgi:hypothetical protein